MATLLILCFSFLLSRSMANPVAPVITPPPINRRQDSFYTAFLDYTEDPGFIGFIQTSRSGFSSYWTTDNCGGDTIFTSVWDSDAYYGACCYLDDTSSDCYSSIVTTCFSGSSGWTAYSAGGSKTCSSDAWCNTDTIFPSSTANEYARSWLGCVPNTISNRLFYQSMPGEVYSSIWYATDSSSSSSTTSSSSSSRSSSSSSSTPRETAPASSTATPEPIKKDSPSKAWIAGVVIGGLALIAIAILVFWLLRMRKKNKEPAYQHAPQTAQMYPQQPIPDGYTSPRMTTSTVSPYQDQNGYNGAFIPSPLSDSNDDGRVKSYYQHVVSPGPQFTAQPTVPGELRASYTPTAAELPELVIPNGSRR